jgi:hypothetical protein
LILGAGGKIDFLEEGSTLVLTGTSLVDNTSSAPGVSGCGGYLVELLLNPIVKAIAGLPAAPGKHRESNTVDGGTTAAYWKTIRWE